MHCSNASVASREEEGAEHLAVARYLIDQGANLNVQDWYGESPLWAAVTACAIWMWQADRDNGNRP